MLELAFEKHDASFIVILPKEVDGLNDLIKKLESPSALESARSKMDTFEVNVFLPKFKIETKTDLQDILEKVSIVNNVTVIVIQFTTHHYSRHGCNICIVVLNKVGRITYVAILE